MFQLSVVSCQLSVVSCDCRRHGRDGDLCRPHGTRVQMQLRPNAEALGSFPHTSTPATALASCHIKEAVRTNPLICWQLATDNWLLLATDRSEEHTSELQSL